MPNSPVYRLRIEPRLKRLIDARRGSESLSTWLRRAASQRLEAEQGLGPEHVDRLAEQSAQLRGLGINLNQLAHAANEGRPVVLNPQMLASLQGLLRETRTLLAEIKERLPE
ncbi:MAG: plasmid mobilization relaxosome protein MobC [Bdellovibrio bacteriovorus]